MTIISKNQIPQALKSLDSKISCVLVYGPDEGLVREKAKQIAKQVTDDLNDPFNVVRPDIAKTIEEPSILADELSSLSMMGGRRLVFLESATDKCKKACEIALDVDKTDNLLIVTAGSLAKASKLRQLFEKADNAACLAFYADEDRDIEGVIFEILNSYGMRAEAPAVSYLISALGSDRSVTRGEIEKLALFKANDPDKNISLDDAKAAIGDNTNLALNDIVYAVANGQPQALDALFEKATIQSESPIAILRMLQSHLQKLQITKGYIEEGLPVETALNKLKPKLFFKDKNEFKAQLYKWTMPKLIKAQAMCQKAEIDCKTTGMPDVAICARTCLSLSVSVAR